MESFYFLSFDQIVFEDFLLVGRGGVGRGWGKGGRGNTDVNSCLFVGLQF